MSKHFGFVLTALLILVLSGCASRSEAPVIQEKTAAAAPAPKSTASSEKKYTNAELGFSFRIPNSWESENYTPVITSRTEKQNGASVLVGTVAFLFENDPENSLLTIEITPKPAESVLKKGAPHVAESSASTTEEPLGTNGGRVYRFSIPPHSTYDVGPKCDLYNSMVLPPDDVVNRFRFLTQDGKELSPESSSASR